MRAASILVAIALFLAACSGSGDTASSTTTSTTATPTTQPTPTTQSTPTTQASTVPPATSTTSPTSTSSTTTSDPIPFVIPELLIAGDDGVHLVDPDGATTLLVEGPAAFAIDDLDGGILFQQERDTRQRRSTVYRVRADGDRAVATLVADLDQSLALSGIVMDDDEVFVYYTRDEGDNPGDARQTLRRYGLTSRTVTELATIGGWESGSYPISVGDGLLLFNWFAEASHGIEVTDLFGSVVAVAGNPSPAEGFVDCNVCPFIAEISGDASRIVYRQVMDFTDFAIIVDVATGEELHRIALNGINRWRVTSFDLGTTHLVVNRADNDGRLAALVYDLTLPDAPPLELAVAGEAYLTRSPVTVTGPVPAP